MVEMLSSVAEVKQLEAEAKTVQKFEKTTKTRERLMLGNQAYYRFLKGNFDNKIASKDHFIKVKGKIYFKGIKESANHIVGRYSKVS